MRSVCEFTKATAEAWPLNAAQRRGDSAVLRRSAQSKENKAFRSSSSTTTSSDGWSSSKRTTTQAVSLRRCASRFRTGEKSSFRLSYRHPHLGLGRPATTRAHSSQVLPTAATVDASRKFAARPGPASAALQGYVHAGKLLPNPSLERTATGWPRYAGSTLFAPRGQPVAAAQLKR